MLLELKKLINKSNEELKMENYTTNVEGFYDYENSCYEEKCVIEKYKKSIDTAIQDIIESGKRLVFASVVKKANVTNIMIYKYPELRTYILKEIESQKQLHVINEKIEKAVSRLKKFKRNVTFVALMNSCSFDYDDMARNAYIKERIREVVIENVKCKRTPKIRTKAKSKKVK